MSDMKKLLSILSESSTASGSVATVSTAGNSMTRRPTDTIFAAENSEPVSAGPESAPKVDSPANFELWRNSAVIGKDQYGKHGRKKAVIDKTKMYPQIKESQYKQVHQAGIDAVNRSRQSAERNAGLNEPDELVPDFGYNKKTEFGTWYFTYPDGTVVEKNGKPVLASSRQGAADILAIAKKHGVMIKQNDGAPPNLTETNDADYEFPEDMADYSPEDWEQWDAKVGRVGELAKSHDSRVHRNADSEQPQKLPEAYEEFEFDDEDEEESGLRNGGYVRDKEDSSREVFIMRGDPYERRVQITDRNGSGWNISPSRLIPVSDSDPAIARYFGESMMEGSESSIEKKIRAKQDSLSLAREQRRAKGQRGVQGQREIKLQAEIDRLNTELTQLKKQGLAEATGDTKFDSMMGGITSPEALDTNEALALIRDLVYGGGASYEEALQQASVSFGINRAKLHALYKKQGMMESTGQLNIGDPVIISGNVQFKGKTGDVADIGRDGAFVVVDLYNHGKKSFHSSDVSYNDYADSEDEGDMMEGFGGRVDTKPSSSANTVSEISDNLRNKYVTKASSDYSDANFSARAAKSHPGLEDYSREQERRAKKRARGLNMALSDRRLGREEVSENRVDSPVSQAITRRILNQYPGLLKYGPDKVMAAIDEVSEWHKVGPDDEIGSSDVSAWVKEVVRYLQTGAGEGLAEAQDKNKSVPPTTPRNFVAKNAKTAGAGAHKDMKRAAKQGDVKHKSRQHELSEAEITEEMIADRLKDELALFKSGTKAKSKDIGKKAPDREVQPKKSIKKDSE